MKTKVKAQQTSIAVPVLITEEMIESLIVSALEGGSNYWYRIENEKLPLNRDKCIDAIGIIRNRASLSISEFPVTGKGTESGVLCRASIVRALRLMAEKHPRHFADLIKDDADAETGDVFFQLAILGDVVYG